MKFSITNARPDVILLTVENRETGLPLFEMIRATFPALPVVVISPRTEEGADAAITALQNKAVDVITIPKQRNIILFAEQHLSKRLFSIIQTAKKSYKKRNINEEILNSLIYPQNTFSSFISEHHSLASPEIVVIGCCTGGPKALFSLVKKLPADFQIPIVIIQHFPKVFTQVLAEKLDENALINVREAYAGAGVEPGTVWIAPGGYHCEVEWQGNKSVLNIYHSMREHSMLPVSIRCFDRLYGLTQIKCLEFY